MEALMQQDISELDTTEVQFSFLRRPFIQNMIPTDKVSTGNIRKFPELKDIAALVILNIQIRTCDKIFIQGQKFRFTFGPPKVGAFGQTICCFPPD